jgi:chromosome segregation ATPase
MQKPAAQSTDPEADDVDDEQPPLSPTMQTNGTPHHSISSAIALGLARSRSQQGLPRSPPPPSDSSARLDAVVQERDALRQEVTELRKSLEDIQSKQDAGASEDSQSKHEEEMRSLREELDEANEGKEHFETQYKNLLGRVNTIKTSLGDRLKADAVGTLYRSRMHTG